MYTYIYTTNCEIINESNDAHYVDIELTDINSDGQAEISGFINVDGTDAAMVDIDRDGTFDIGYVDYDGDGAYNFDDMEDISDYNFKVEDFVLGIAEEEPVEAIEFGAEVSLLDDDQCEINEEASMYDFMSTEAQIDEFENMLSELDDITSELDDIINDCGCDSAYMEGVML